MSTLCSVKPKVAWVSHLAALRMVIIIRKSQRISIPLAGGLVLQRRRLPMNQVLVYHSCGFVNTGSNKYQVMMVPHKPKSITPSIASQQKLWCSCAHAPSLGCLQPQLWYCKCLQDKVSCLKSSRAHQ